MIPKEFKTNISSHTEQRPTSVADRQIDAGITKCRKSQHLQQQTHSSMQVHIYGH